jgi:hypothetical protein
MCTAHLDEQTNIRVKLMDGDESSYMCNPTETYRAGASAASEELCASAKTFSGSLHLLLRAGWSALNDGFHARFRQFMKKFVT